MMGHLLDFFVGDSQNLRDRVGRSLENYDPDHPRTGFVQGMHAFGLEESGQYDRAEGVGLEAVHRNPDDVWGIHAVVHAYEMRGMVDAGIRFLRSRERTGATATSSPSHNWWHLALYLLEAGRHDEALAIYDAEVHNDGSPGVSLQLLDASALLWRFTLDEIDTGDRYAKLAAAWEQQIPEQSWYVFNDFHAVVALCGAGRVDDARAVVKRLERYVAEAPMQPGTNREMAAEVGVAVSRAVVAYTDGRHDDVVAGLLPVRRKTQAFGGSHAQRDLIQRILTESAIRAGRLDLARALVDERLSQRDTQRLRLASSGVGGARLACHGPRGVGGATAAGRRGLPPAGARPARLRAEPARGGRGLPGRRRRHRRPHGRRRPPRRSLLRRVGRDVRRRPPSRSDQVADAARARRLHGRPGPS